MRAPSGRVLLRPVGGDTQMLKMRYGELELWLPVLRDEYKDSANLKCEVVSSGGIGERTLMQRVKGWYWDEDREPELCAGDVVYVNFMAWQGEDDVFRWDGEEYWCVPYEMMVAKEGVDGVLVPLNGNVLVDLVKEERRLASGLYLPDVTHEDRGVVLAMSPAVVMAYDGGEAGVGDEVMFKREGAMQMGFFGIGEQERRHWVVSVEDIMLVIKQQAI
ncbi:MAG: hypothetical protein D6746_01095 [Bacteroidetes bacterium]|nr:MAG: hypothetical protein D6746_01095 [Bacteroidota bacterium]